MNEALRQLSLWESSCLEDVFEQTPPGAEIDILKIHLLQNETEGIQLALRSELELQDVSLHIEGVPTDAGLTVTARPIRRVFCSRGCDEYGIGQYTRVKDGAAIPGFFPEYYEDTSSLGVLHAGQSESFLIEATARRETPAGEYQLQAVLETVAGCREIPLTVRVAGAMIPEPKDSGFSYACWSDTLNESVTAGLFGIQLYTEAFWELMANYAAAMKRDRQNVLFVPAFELIRSDMSIDETGSYHFAFRNFDRYIETFLDNGSFRLLEGDHLFDKDWHISPPPPGGYPHGECVMKIYVQGDHGVQFRWVYASSPQAETHLRQYLPLLNRHLQEKGWAGIWAQHVLDEALSPQQAAQMKPMYQWVRQSLPDCCTIDAVTDVLPSGTFGPEVSIQVARVDAYDREKAHFDSLRREGVEIWSYTCTVPQGDHMQRLGDYPLLSTRIIGWYAFKNRHAGYLHWAWNLWGWTRGTTQNRGSAAHPLDDMDCPGGPIDAWLRYPNISRPGVFDGTRASAVRDGFEDYELLCLAAQKNRKRTEDIVTRAVGDSQVFERDPRTLLSLREELIAIAES